MAPSALESLARAPYYVKRQMNDRQTTCPWVLAVASEVQREQNLLHHRYEGNQSQPIVLPMTPLCRLQAQYFWSCLRPTILQSPQQQLPSQQGRPSKRNLTSRPPCNRQGMLASMVSLPLSDEAPLLLKSEPKRLPSWRNSPSRASPTLSRQQHLETRPRITASLSAKMDLTRGLMEMHGEAAWMREVSRSLAHAHEQSFRQQLRPLEWAVTLHGSHKTLRRRKRWWKWAQPEAKSPAERPSRSPRFPSRLLVPSASKSRAAWPDHLHQQMLSASHWRGYPLLGWPRGTGPRAVARTPSFCLLQTGVVPQPLSALEQGCLQPWPAVGLPPLRCRRRSQTGGHGRRLRCGH
mmetsp:Transcript_77306/g.171173  ORF Transcript_77306/g.171173 Transcript_77306/m.171173 type:complete len:350 (+) Transcript_77306:542-1591(+)